MVWTVDQLWLARFDDIVPVTASPLRTVDPDVREALAVAAAIVIVCDADAGDAVPSPSVNLTVNVKVPTALAVPEIVPLELSESPGGNEPLASDQVYVPAPPYAESGPLE